MGNAWQAGIIDFGRSIYGFEEYSQFKVEATNEDSPFSMLSSVGNGNIGFLVTSPFELDKSYEFQLTDDMIQTLKAERADDIAVMVIVTVKRPFEKSTANLLAPLVVNMKNGIGRQIVLTTDRYSVHTPLFSTRIEGDE